MTGPHPDPDALSELIGLVYESAWSGPQWQALIDRLAELHPGVAAGVIPYEGETFLAPLTRSQNPPPALGEPDYDRVRLPRTLDDPPTASTPPGQVTGTAAAFDERDWIESEVYRTFLAPAGHRHAISLNVGAVDGCGILLTFAIPEDPAAHARVHDPLHDILCRLSPHVVRAARMASELMATRRIAAAAGSALDAHALPVVVVDAGGTVLFANAAGRRMLDRGRPVRITPARRMAAAGAGGRALAGGLREAAATLAPAALRLETPDGPVSCCIVPLRVPGEGAGRPDRRADRADRLFAVYFGPAGMAEPALGVLARAFGLTPREAEICAALAGGRSPGEIAGLSGRSPKTVRNQIHVIHGKVGVSSGRELIDALAVFRAVGAIPVPDAGDGAAALSLLPD